MQHRVKQHSNEKGMTLIFGTLSMLFIVPMMGLAVDVGFMYSVKSKLQASVDGAALAAARGLNIGTNLTSQTASAQANAVNWFYSNFPNGYFGTHGTVMATANVTVAPDATNPNMQDVTVSASTMVDTFFMKWLAFDATTINANGKASRLDVVVTLVLDVSGSMQSAKDPTTGIIACNAMVTAAKTFVGQFQNGRDRMGLVAFSTTGVVKLSPTQSFRSSLGYYVSATDKATGLIDGLAPCNGNTNTAEGLTLGYDQLYKTNLPGAFNTIMFMTDGIPNSVTVNMAKNMLSTSLCKDATGVAVKNGGDFVKNPPTWTTTTQTLYSMPSISRGPIGVIRADDPSSSGTYGMNMYTGTSPDSSTITTNAPGCAFAADQTTWVKDFQTLPPNDAFGNSLTGYNAVTTDGSGNVVLAAKADSGKALTGNNLTFHYVARNAADDSALSARTNATIPATIFGVGLGDPTSKSTPPDYDFMQRLTNDGSADTYTGKNLYDTYTMPTAWSTQPVGMFRFAPTSSELSDMFLQMASQILRLSK